ncbi:MAG: excinuclease ABC subunit UvrC, partial [Fidelibacterota bacterium]
MSGIDLKSKIRLIPRKPGVYIFRDRGGKILYIGKARVLRSRVSSYFRKAPESPKLASLVRRTKDVEWIVTGSEVEALLAEANLVKEHQPKYNVNLKDDKSFPYIRITHEPYPQVLLTRNVVRDGSKYFGPYTEVKSLRETLKVLHKVFPIRSCNYRIDEQAIKKKRISVCLDYHIQKCEGPCEGRVSRKEYDRMIRNIIGFLHGKTEPALQDLRVRMERASREMRYETAALYRDQLKAVESFSRRQRKVAASFDDQDVVAVEARDDDACTVVIRLRNGRIVGREKVYMTGVDGENPGRTLSDFVRQFYLETDSVPGEIILESRPTDESTLSL